ncbi:MgtC/SapB family protein [Lysobacter sp. KIS68-7]|uniref:MgtC/SapB family protein n=1 Tax=Lysobacter sp. KIS68-7 TaxID=2904252 RepID=UPI001E4ACE55|nr:MgtC/SapB family protein [Lysobacter sp. KIS68-7]UHQ19398.1 MgtC/SapB family protein [Lysobacter sp. KIS68-7]
MPFATQHHFWSPEILRANGSIALTLLGALALGMLVGYERSYRGRAAGMRTYGLVCMASAALTVLVGFRPLWYGGVSGPLSDPTSVVQGVVTGIGFLCAGVIIKDGLSVRGLATAASIWSVSAVGVLFGAGFYVAASVFAVLCALSMSLLHQLEHRLPGRTTLDLHLTFRAGFRPSLDEIAAIAQERGYRILRDSVTIKFADNQPVWRLAVIGLKRSRALSPALLAEQLTNFEGMAKFSITPVRN